MVDCNYSDNENPNFLIRGTLICIWKIQDITNNNQMREDITFLTAGAKSYFKMTKCLYKMNDFTTHFSIKDDSTMVVIDSVISENNSGACNFLMS